MNRSMAAVVPLLFLLSACELTLEVDLPAVEPVLTVNSFFTPDSVWKVHVSDAPALVDGRGAIRGQTDAVVTLLSEDGLETLSLTHSGEGFYSALSGFPRANIPYLLKVQVRDYEAIQAIDAVPEPIAVDLDFSIDEVEESDFFQRRYVSATFEVRFVDRPAQSDYFRLFILLEPKAVCCVQRIPYEVRHGSILAESPTPDDIGDENEGITLWDAIFTDAGFDGEEVELTLKIERQCTENCFGGIGEEELEEGRFVVRLYLLQISKAFYDYATTYELQQDYGGGPDANPVRVVGNVENGFGVFAGYNTYSLDLVVPDSLAVVP